MKQTQSEERRHPLLMMKEKQLVHKAFTELAPRYEAVVDGELNTFWGWSYQDFVDQLVDRTEIPE